MLPPRSVSPRTRRLVRGALLAVAGGLAGAGAYVLAVVPPTPDSLYPGCQFHTLTGLHCPGCGTTRALHAALNGRFAQAVAYNPLALVVLPVLGWSVARSLWLWWREKPPAAGSGRWATVGLKALAAAMILFGLLRNIPVYPFTLLAPHEL